MMKRRAHWSAGTRFLLVLSLSGALVAPPLEGQVETAVAQAESWLVGVQNPDGSFGALADMGPRDSALAVLALRGAAAAEPALASGAIYLQGVPESNSHFRSQRALALAATGRSFSPLLDSIFEFKNGGGMGAFGDHQSTLLDTGLAVEALTLEEAARLLDIAALVDFLQLHQEADGGWGFVPGTPSGVYYTAEVLRALAGLEQLTIGAAVRDGATTFLLGRQQADGGFGSVVDTALAYRALLAAGTDATTFPFGSPVPYLLGRQSADGSWEGDTFTTAQVVLALRGQRPNLVIGTFEAPESVATGLLIALRIVVRNVGPEPAPASRLEIRFDTAEGELAAAAPIPALAPGAETEIVLDVDAADRDGRVTLVALADAASELSEVDEEDNTATVAVNLRAGPDLALFPEDLSLLPPAPEPDQGFELLAAARNLGESEVASFTYRVSRLVGGAAPELLTEGTAGPIDAGGGLLVTVPLTLAAGEHTVEVTLDPDDQVGEPNEANNRTTLTFFVVDQDQPDLSIADADLVLTPAEPDPGGLVDVSVTVANLGNLAAAADLVLLESNSSDGGVELRRVPLTLAAGAAQTVSDTVPLSLDAFALTAVVDPDGLVLETDESNNRVVRVFRELPDLAIGFDNLEILTPSPLDGDPVEVRLTVRNAGTATATGVAVEVTAGGSPVFSDLIAEIPAAGNAAVGFTWTAAAGLNTLAAVADAGDAILEISESNNRAEREVAVPRSSGPDLEIVGVDRTGFTESAADLSVDGSIDVTITNSGDADVAAPFELRLFEDRDGDERFDIGEPVLAGSVVTDPLPVGATRTLSLAIDATVAFHHPLAWAEVDAGDVIAEQREDNNRATLFTDCEPIVDVPLSGIDPVEEWFLPGVEVESAPVVVQLSDDNGDGRVDSRDVPDVVFHTSDAEGSAVLAVSGLDGSTVWSFRATPANPVLNELGQLAAADIDGDGIAEVIAHQLDGSLVALEHTGELKWVSERVEGVGNRGLGSISVADVTGDGVPEIVHGRSVISNSGQLLALGTANRGQNFNFYGPLGVALVPGTIGYAHSVVADVDLDGAAEIVAGDALYEWDVTGLAVVWDRTVPERLMSDGFSAVANLDGDPEAEIVYVSSNHVMVLEHDGTVRSAQRQIIRLLPLRMPTFWGGPPTIADLDGDGAAEILVGGATELVAYRAGLSVLWRAPIGPDFGNITGVTAFDLDGDGSREVLFNDETTFYVLDGATGTVLHSRPNTSKTGTEYPVVADVDGDGRAEIALGSNTSFAGDASTTGLHVLGDPSWRGTRPIWNQYGSGVTNVGLDATVPAAPEPPWLVTNTFRTNRELTPPPRHLANVTVSFPRVATATPEGLPITVRVGNGGRAAVPAGLEVTLFDGGAGGAVGGTATTSRALLPGDFEDVVVLWQVAGAGGTAAAVVDPQGRLPECDEGDNEVSFEVLESLLPDLVIASGGVTAPSPARAGTVVPVTVSFSNIGNAAAPPFAVRLFDSDPALGVGLGEIATATPLLPGESRDVVIPWDSLGTAGVHLVHAVLDPDGAVPEARLDNNVGLAPVELLPPASPDLAVESLAVDPPAVVEGETVVVTATVANRGAAFGSGFSVALSINGVENQRTEVPTPLAPGELRDVAFELPTLGLRGTFALTVDVDPDAELAEEDETNNRARVDLPVAGSGLDLAVVTDRILYLPDEDVAIQVTAAGTEASTLTLRVRLLDAFGAEVALVAEESLELVPGETFRDLTWNTGAVLPGPYTVSAELLEAGVPRAQAVAGISVSPDLQARATLFANRDAYEPLDVVILTGAVTNTSANTPLAEAEVLLTIADAGRVEVFSSRQTIGALSPGASLSTGGSWEIAGAAAGTYTATAAVRDRVGRLVTFTETTFTVEDSARTGGGLLGELDAAPSELGAGAPVVTSWQVRNRGNADFSELVLRLDLVSLATQEVAEFRDVLFPLSRQESRTGGHVFATGGLVPGTYLAILSALVPDGKKRLDTEAFTVGRGVSIADSVVIEGDSGTRAARFDVTLSSPAEAEITVDYATRDSSAVAGADYLAAAGTLVFAPGETAAAVDVQVLGDLEAEVDEVFLVELSQPQGVLLGDAEAMGEIVDEEGCASPELLANGSGEEATATDDAPGWTSDGSRRRRFADPEPLNGSAYLAISAGELVQEVDVEAYAAAIDAGLVRFAHEVFVRPAVPVADPAAEVGRLSVDFLDADGNVLTQAQDAAFGGIDGWQGIGAVTDAPAATRRVVFRVGHDGVGSPELYVDRAGLVSLGQRTVTVTDAALDEGDSGTRALSFQVVLGCPAETALTVSYATVAGSAEAGVDFTAAAGDLVFAAGEIAGTVTVDVLGDAIDEDDETFQLVLSGPADLVLLDRVADATIRDDDGAVDVRAAAVAAVLEGDAGGTVEAVFEVALSAPSGRTVRVDYATADATATAGADYRPASGTVSFAPGETTAEVRVEVLGDGVGEADETFALALSNPVHATLAGDGEATIRDDDLVEISIGDVTVLEGDAGTSVELVFPVSLSIPSERVVEVSYATADAGATAGADYESAAGALVFAAGATAGEIRVSGLGDDLLEDHETFLVVLSSPVHGQLSRPEGTGTLFDDDGILISVRDAAVFEAHPITGAVGEAEVLVTLNRASTEEVSVEFATVDGTAIAGQDYVAAAGVLTIAPGATSGAVPVTILDDVPYEGDERFALELDAPLGGELLDAVAEIRVFDDDGWTVALSSNFNNRPYDPEPIEGCIVLTDERAHWFGAASWRKDRLDLARSFDKTFRVYLGDRDEAGFGMTFMLQNEGATAVGSGSTFIGARGVSPSFGVEMTTRPEDGFVRNDHMSILVNGILHQSSAAVSYLPGSGPRTPFADGDPNVEDGEEHLLRIVWNAATRTLDTHFDGDERLWEVRDAVAEIFAGTSEVYYGFTAGNNNTNNNLQYFCETETCNAANTGPKISIGDARVLEGDAGTVQAVFPVTLSCPHDQEIRVDWETRDGGSGLPQAIAGVDYHAASGSLVFPPGETSGHLAVEVIGEGLGEVTEHFFVELRNAVGAEIRYGVGAGTILTDDALFSLESHPLLEGDPLLADPLVLGTNRRANIFAVNLASPIPRESRVSWRVVEGTARLGEDVIAAQGTLVFTSPDTSRHFNVHTVRDILEEGPESFFIELFDPVSGTVLAERWEIVIDDDDGICSAGPSLVANGSALAGIDGTWDTVSGAWDRTVQSVEFLFGSFTPSCGATGTNELAQDVDLAAFAVKIDRGQLDFRFEGFIQKIREDAVGTVVVELYALDGTLLDRFDFAEQVPASYTQSRHWARISNLFRPPPGTRRARLRLISEGACRMRFDRLELQALDTPFFTIGDAGVQEGDTGTIAAVLDVDMSCPQPFPVSVDYFTADATATAPADYEAAGGTLVYLPGELRKSVAFEVRGDTLSEGNEQFRVLLAGAVGDAQIADGEGLVTIQDDEAFLDVFSQDSGAAIAEGDDGTSSLRVLVQLSRTSELEVRVSYATVDAGATAGSDYLETSGTLVFAPGERSRILEIPVLGDTLEEDDECLDFELRLPINATLSASRASVRLCIANDDQTLGIESSEVLEGDAGITERPEAVFAVRLSQPSLEVVRVDFATADGTAQAGVDYQATSGTLSFSIGSTTRFITVPVLGDTVVEGSETFTVTLSDPVNANLAVSEATGIIVDDDDCRSANLLINGGAEEPFDGVSFAGWTEVAGDWEPDNPFGIAINKFVFRPDNLNAGTNELAQDVDVTRLAERIDGGLQRFLFEGLALSLSANDSARIVVEYRDAANAAILDVFDSGEIVTDTRIWQPVSDVRLAPVGTRFVRVRLISRELANGNRAEGVFDALALRVLGKPTLHVPRPIIGEGDEGTRPALFRLELACPLEETVTVDFQTVDGTAQDGADYLGTAGRLEIAPGELEAAIEVPILGDLAFEPIEEFTLELVSSANAPLTFDEIPGVIYDDDTQRFLFADEVVVAEPDAGQEREALLVLRLSAPNGEPAVVDLIADNGSARLNIDWARPADFGRIEFGPNESVKTATLLILGDDEPEGEESFSVRLTGRGNVAPLRQRVRIRILDNDDFLADPADGDCLGPNTIRNGGGEGIVIDGVPTGWTAVRGVWGADVHRSTPPEGNSALAPLEGLDVELAQDIDLSAYSEVIDSGQLILRLRALMEVGRNFVFDPSTGRLVLEYRDAVTGDVLDVFDSGDREFEGFVYQEILDQRPVPPGTGFARLRLTATGPGPETPQVFFDALELRSVGLPVLSAEDVPVTEGDPSGSARFDLRVSCRLPDGFSVGYETVGETATAGVDFVPTSGTLAVAPGEILASVPVTLIDDAVVDPGETFALRLTVSPPGAVVIDNPAPRALIADDDNIRMDLGLCLDNSNSIGNARFRLQVDGTAEAVQNPAILPRDGSVRLTVLQFADTTVIPVGPVVIDETNVGLVVESVRSILSFPPSPIGRGSNLPSCIDMAAAALTLPGSRKQVLDLSTDGEVSLQFSLDARLRALQAGIDVINSIAVSDSFLHVLLQLIHPQPEGGPEGFIEVTPITFLEYAEALGRKMRREANPDLVVTLDDGLDTVDPGTVVTYTLTVENAGSGLPDGFDVALVLPAEVTGLAYVPSAGQFDPASGRWSGVVLDTGKSAVLTISGVVDPAPSATLVATATVTSADGLELDPADNTASDTTELIGIALPQLTVAKTDALPFETDGEANPGDVVRYTVTVSNTGDAPATGVAVTDAVPADTAVVPGSVTASQGTVTSESPLSVDVGEIVAGATVSVTFDVAIDDPLPDEVERISNQAVVASAETGDVVSDDPDEPGEADATVTPVFGAPEIVATKTDALELDGDADGVVSPGDAVRYTITVENTGTASATGVVLRDLVPEHTAIVAGSVTTSAGTVTTEDPVEIDLGSLAAGAVVTVTFDAAIDDPIAVGVTDVSNQGTVTSDQLPAVLTDDPDVAGDADPTVTMVTAAPRLLAEKTDALVADNDGDPSPRDVVEYTVTLRNLGNVAAMGVRFLDLVPEHTSLVDGSVTASAGTIVTDDPVDVDVGELAVGTDVVITFLVLVADPIPAGVTEIANQGAVAADGLDDVLTDDPDAGGEADPTVTPITAAPVLVVEKSDVLFTDAGGDSVVSPGDELLYTIEISNTGNTGATAVRLGDATPPDTTLVAGTVQSSQGTVVTEDPVDVDLGLVDAGASATVTFRVLIDDPFPFDATGVANQATVTSAELAPVPSDDPDTPAAADATATPVVIATDISIGDAQVTEGDSGTVEAVFTVSLSSPSNREVTADYETADGEAVAGADYESVTGSVVFAPGETAQTVSVTVLSDRVDELDETFTVLLSSPAGGTVVDGEGLGTILDDDAPPLVSVADVAATEGDTGTTDAVFAVTLSAVSSFDVTVSFQAIDGEAVAGADYLAASGAVLIPAGSQAASILVGVLGDPLDEPDETFTVVLSDPVNAGLGDAEGLGTIVDNDPPPSLAVTDVTVVEAPSAGAVFTVSLSAPSSFDVTVDYQTADATALAGVDYTAASGSLSFAAGTTSATVTVTVLDDALDESDETFVLNLANVANAVLPARGAVATVVDDDPEPAVAVADVSVVEGTGTDGAAVFTLTLSAPSGREARVSYQTADGGLGLPAAAAGEDYQAVTGTAVFPPGTTVQTVSVTVTGDAVSEPDEAFRLLLSSPVHATLADAEALATIFDDDTLPVVTLGDVTVAEGDPAGTGSGTSDAVFTLSLDKAGGVDVTVSYQTSDGGSGLPAALAGTDYLAATGTVTIPAGSLSATLSVEVLGDLVDERDEAFTVLLSDPQNATLGDGDAFATIVDDDEARLVIDDVEVDEGDTGTSEAIFTVELTLESDREVTVGYTSVDETATAGADYLAADGTLVFAPGTRSRTLTVSVLGDLLLENLAETFRVELSDAVGAAIEDGTGIGTILDDEACLGPDLVMNPSAEQRDVGGAIAGWTPLAGDFRRRAAPPDPVDGRVSFFAGEAAYSELYQDVDVRAFDAGTEYAFSGFVRTFEESPPDVVRIVVEYRDATNTVVLDAYDSGEIMSPLDWTPLADVREAPAGTGWIRLRLLATRFTGPDNDGFVDALSLRSRRTATVRIDDVTLAEGDSGTIDAVFTVSLSCAYEHEVSLSYSSADGTASANEDYLPTSGTLVFPVGTTARTIPVPVLGDTEHELHETFFVDLGGLSSAGPVVLADARGQGTIRNDDFCPRSPGFWKNHVEQWPVDYLLIGGREVEAEEMLELLSYNGPDAASKLARQLVATKLNLAVGSDPFIRPVVADADAYLEAFPPGSDPRGEDRDLGNALKDELDAYNNLDCEEQPVDPNADPGEDDDDGGSDEDDDDGGSDEDDDGSNEDDDGSGGDGACTRSAGFWSTHPGDWPASELSIGDDTVDAGDLQSYLDYGGPDASLKLARQLVAARFNLLSGSESSIEPTADAADAFLVDHPPGSDPKGQAKQQANALKDELESYNTRSCDES